MLAPYFIVLLVALQKIDGGAEQAFDAFETMMAMKKIDIATIEAARQG